MKDPKAQERVAVLRAESLAAWREGEAFLVRAREEAAGIRAQAETDAEALHEQARQLGYEDGRQAGIEAAAVLALDISAQREAELLSLEPRLIEAIDVAVRKILDSFNDEDLVARVGRKALAELRGSSELILRVAPGMAAKLDAMSDWPVKPAVTIRESDALQGKQCFLDTPAGTIELTAPAQWGRILSALQSATKGEI